MFHKFINIPEENLLQFRCFRSTVNLKFKFESDATKSAKGSSPYQNVYLSTDRMKTFNCCLKHFQLYLQVLLATRCIYTQHNDK
jgi:hypothetical protein